jgi:hypothetical protein
MNGLMKRRIAWLALAVGITTGAFGGTAAYLEANPRRVIVVLDSSYPLGGSWDSEMRAARRIGQSSYISGGDYAVFAAYTDKGLIHSWRPKEVALGNIQPYAPRDYERLAVLAAAPDFQAADEIFYVTTVPNQSVPAGWQLKWAQ